MKKTLLALALVAATASASAGELWLNAGGLSYHFDRSQGFNEVNKGIGLEYRTSPEVSFMAGQYNNSVRKDTQYAAVLWQPLSIGSVKLGVAGGVMNGYPGVNNGGAFPALLPMATWEGKTFGLNVGIIPQVGKKVHGAVIVQFKVRIK